MAKAQVKKQAAGRKGAAKVVARVKSAVANATKKAGAPKPAAPATRAAKPAKPSKPVKPAPKAAPKAAAKVSSKAKPVPAKKAAPKAAPALKKAASKPAKAAKAAVKKVKEAAKAVTAKAKAIVGKKPAASPKTAAKPAAAAKTSPAVKPVAVKPSTPGKPTAAPKAAPKAAPAAKSAVAPKAAAATAKAPAAPPKPALKPAAVPPTTLPSAPVAPKVPAAPVVDDKKRSRRPRPKVTSSGAPAASWLTSEKPRAASFIPAPPRAEAPSAVAAPPASSDRLIRADDVAPFATTRTVPVRVDLEQSGGRTDVIAQPQEVSLRVGEGIEWDFRYFGGTDVTVDEVVIEFENGISPFTQSTFRTRKPGTARPHRQMSGPAEPSAVGKRATYIIRAISLYRTELATAKLAITVH
ncbi:MAG TPA: hypothetical protein VGF69_03310 [Thermoanaerobaculia bacterium]|jgi:hypothetical protein